MSVEIGDGSGEVEDELFDLNKEPVERKRKRVEKSNSSEKGNEGCNGIPNSGRVLRSRTVAMSDGEKQVIKMEIVEIDDEDETEVPRMDHRDESEVPVFQKGKKKKGRRGRPPKMGYKCDVPSMLDDKDENEEPGMECKDESKVPVFQKRKKKGRRGRPPKTVDKCQVPFKLDDNDETEVSGVECKDESKAPVLLKRKVKKGRRGRPPKSGVKCKVPSLSNPKKRGRGRPPKVEVRCEVSSLSIPKKRGRGRPPKVEGKCEISSLNKKIDDEVMEHKKVGDGSNGAGQCQGSPDLKRRRGRTPKVEGECQISLLNTKREDEAIETEKVDDSNYGSGYSQGSPNVKRKRGRPPKVENGSVGLGVKKEIVARNSDHTGSANGGPAKRLKVDENHMGSSFFQQKKATVASAEGEELGLRERKQLLRDQIVAMLKKAGWTVEYRQRLSKEYQDAVYVDRQGKTYWSVTLAYKKFKERIDTGKAEDKDVLAYNPIPEETLSLLFRITEKGKKAGKKKNGLAMAIQRIKKESSKRSSSDGKIKSRQTLLARRPKPENGSDTDGYELYEGKRTLLSWMIDLGTVPLGGKVRYKRGRSKRILREGRITKEGICCDCCNITYTISSFESHAECTPGKPYWYIYLDSGNSLFQCLVDSWKKHMQMNKIEFASVDVEGDDPNDDTCNVCGDGGDLICCDSCPSTFHHGCLRIQVPSGDWHCAYCSCKFCGVSCENTSSTDNDDDDDLSSEFLTCRLCEEKFHLHCTNEMIAKDFEDEDHSFCGMECSKILEQLQALLGVRHELGEEFSYTVLKHRAVSDDAALIDNYSKIETNSKLAVAFSVMDECFEPIIDERSGTNVIHNVVYSCGSNIKRLSYDGFYTIVLEKGDELVSAASIRIHGKQLAEMPFIGTRYAYRRQGMCNRLLNAVEMVLCSLGVEELIIPAISELNETWTKVFGFHPLEESQKQKMMYMSLIPFPGIDMLQKTVQVCEFVNRQNDSAASESSDVRHKNKSVQENPASDPTTSSDPNFNSHGEATMKEYGADECDASAAPKESCADACDASAAPKESCADACDASAAGPTEVQTNRKDAKDEQREGVGVPAELVLDISSDKEAADVKPGKNMSVACRNWFLS